MLLAILGSLSAFAQSYTMTPSSGPSSGGTEVTIKGNFESTPLGVSFGGEAAAGVQRVDANTIMVVAPEHLPGPAAIRFFVQPFGFVTTGLTFTYTGDVPATYERLLLPIFLNPVQGQFGSEFVTAFSAQLQQGEQATLYGLQFACRFFCPPAEFADTPIGVGTMGPRIDEDDLVRNGNPGRFIFVPKNELPNVALSLRVFDKSRSAQNYGTELPIVRGDQFRQGIITLLNVPTAARFRNTLRLYATGPVEVTVRVGAATIDAVDQPVTLVAGANVFEPATAMFSTFPTGVGLATVTIIVPQQEGGARVWGFVSVTNNDTQTITTVTPSP